MSIYKGGYILADISDTQLTNEYKDLLSQELKDYLSKFIKDGLYNKEVLMKPLILILQDSNGYISRIEFNQISDDLEYLYGHYIALDYSVRFNIDVDLKIAEENVALSHAN